MFSHCLIILHSVQLLNNQFITPDNAQLQVCYAQIWILMPRLEIGASSWCTHIFKAIKIVDGYLAHQRNKNSKVWNRKFCLPNHIPVCDADWFKCHFWQLYFKTNWSKIHILSKLSLPFYTFVFTSAEFFSLLPGLYMQKSTQQQSLIKILSLREREVLKQLKKIPVQPQSLAYIRLVQL